MYKPGEGFKVIAITNRHIAKIPLASQVDRLCSNGIDTFILREKDLTEKEYRELAEQVISVCEKHSADCILHTFWKVAAELGHKKIHLPLFILERDYEKIKNAGFDTIGCSCHSIEEAVKAVNLGATYITASHIYPTDCKKGLAPRGLEFLKNICDHMEIPVYALGGLKTDCSQFEELALAGADGACLMSGLMTF